MKNHIMLTITSSLAAVLFLLHWVDEINRGLEHARIANLPGVGIILVWLIGALILAGTRTGYVITLLFGILGAGVLVLHMTGGGLTGGHIANTSGIFFWVLTAMALGITSGLSAILSAQALWRSLRRRNQPH